MSTEIYYNVYAVNGITGKVITFCGGSGNMEHALFVAMGLNAGVRTFRKKAYAAIYVSGGELVDTIDYRGGYCPIAKNEEELK